MWNRGRASLLGLWVDVGDSQPHLLCQLHLCGAKDVAEKPPLRPNSFTWHSRRLPRPRDKWCGHLTCESWTSAQVQCQASLPSPPAHLVTKRPVTPYACPMESLKWVTPMRSWSSCAHWPCSLQMLLRIGQISVLSAACSVHHTPCQVVTERLKKTTFQLRCSPVQLIA